MRTTVFFGLMLLVLGIAGPFVHLSAADAEISVQRSASAAPGAALAAAVSPVLGSGGEADRPAPVSWRLPATAAKAAYLIGLLLTLGSGLFRWLVAGPVMPSGLQRMTLAAAVWSLLAGGIYWQLGAADLAGSARLPDVPAMAAALGQSFGISLGTAAAGLLLVLASRALPGPGLAAGLVLLVVSFVVTGHPANREPGWLLMPMMALHVCAAAFWYASLGPLIVGLGRLPAAEAAGLLRRFSRVAVVIVAALFLAGLSMALVHLVSPRALLSTWYGQLLIMKSTWFSVLLALAAWHKLSLSPRLEAGDNTVMRRLRLSIAVEAVVMTLVLLISVNLAQTPPEQPAESARQASAPGN